MTKTANKVVTTRTCYVCGTTKDIRPYGPRGSMICFACMRADSKREAEAKTQFLTQLEACGDVAAIDGTDIGPYPDLGTKRKS